MAGASALPPSASGTRLVTVMPHDVAREPPGAVGTVLKGRYRIAQYLGAGAFSRVYRTEDVLDPTGPRSRLKCSCSPSRTTSVIASPMS